MPVRLAYDAGFVYFFAMNRFHSALLILTASACASAPPPATAQDATPGPDRTLETHATATVRAAPDRASVRLAVETQAPTAREASEANARSMAAVLSALRGAGVPNERIRTQRIELHPRYDHRSGEAELVGYAATNQVAVEVTDIDRVSVVVDTAVSAGANRVTGIRFEVADRNAAYERALREAVARARAEAEVLADALGERLGPALRVTTGGLQPMPTPGPEAMAMRADAAGPPVQPGEVEIQASVRILWRLGS